MSLDLSIISPKTITKKGTGVYIRQNGATVELKSIAEVMKYFPNANIDSIEEYSYVTDVLWHGNITHNLSKMASAVPADDTLTLYDLLWHPNESGFNIVTDKYVGLIENGLKYLKEHKEELVVFNPENGWGNYENLLEFTSDFLVNLQNSDENYRIEAYA